MKRLILVALLLVCPSPVGASTLGFDTMTSSLTHVADVSSHNSMWSPNTYGITDRLGAAHDLWTVNADEAYLEAS